MVDHSNEEKDCNELDAKINETQNEMAIETRKKEDLDTTLRDQKALLKDRTATFASRKAALDLAKQEQDAVTKQLTDAETILDEHSKRLQDLTAQVDELDTVLTQTRDNTDMQQRTFARFTAELAVQKDRLVECRADTAKKIRLVEAVRKKVKEMEEQVRDADDKKEQALV